MISGECRVEPVGLSTGHQLALQGLRLRLDLRIVPGTAEDGSAAAIWRVEDGRVRTLRLGVPEVYRRAAMLAGGGVLVLALAVWFAGSREPADEQGAPNATSRVITTTITPAGEGSTAGAGSVTHAPSVAVSPDVAPQPSPLPAATGPAWPASPSPAMTPPGAAPSKEPAAGEAAAPVLNEPRAQEPPAEKPSASPRPRPVAVRAPPGDNLDLFADPK